jgi:hypothetical protein
VLLSPQKEIHSPQAVCALSVKAEKNISFFLLLLFFCLLNY